MGFDLPVMHVDAHLLVIDKPPGLPSVPGKPLHLRDCAISRLQARWPDALVVHRLDMPTSGLLAFGRGPEAQRALSMAFENRQVHKHYTAVVHGLLNTGGQAELEINLPLITDWPNRPRQIVSHELGKPSLTRVQVLAHDSAANQTRVRLEPITGRTHQLRVHLMAIGHPMVGDALYGASSENPPQGRLLLHASELTLPHPATGEPIRLHSPAPF